MTVVVETGAALPESNSYVDDNFLQDYFDEIRKAKWSNLTSDEKDATLVSATQFIDLSYKWIGERASVEQGLNWPRREACYPESDVLIDGVPKAVQKAVAEAVYILLRQDADISLFSVNGEAQVKKEKLGVIEQEYFEKTTDSEEGTQYEILNRLLAGFYAEAPVNKVSGVSQAKVTRV